MGYLALLTFARIRVRIHCFVYLHKPSYHHYHYPNGLVRVVAVQCKFCGKFFLKDEVHYALLEAEQERLKAQVVKSALSGGQS